MTRIIAFLIIGWTDSTIHASHAVDRARFITDQIAILLPAEQATPISLDNKQIILEAMTAFVENVSNELDTFVYVLSIAKQFDLKRGHIEDLSWALLSHLYERRLVQSSIPVVPTPFVDAVLDKPAYEPFDYGIPHDGSTSISPSRMKSVVSKRKISWGPDDIYSIPNRDDIARLALLDLIKPLFDNFQKIDFTPGLAYISSELVNKTRFMEYRSIMTDFDYLLKLNVNQDVIAMIFWETYHVLIGELKEESVPHLLPPLLHVSLNSSLEERLRPMYDRPGYVERPSYNPDFSAQLVDYMREFNYELVGHILNLAQFAAIPVDLIADLFRDAYYAYE